VENFIGGFFQRWKFPSVAGLSHSYGSDTWAAAEKQQKKVGPIRPWALAKLVTALFSGNSKVGLFKF